MSTGSDGRRAFGTLIRDLAEDSVALIRGETRLAKLELGRAAGAIGRGTAFVALGTVFVLLGAVALLIGLILLAGDQWLPADRYWLAALIVLVVTGGAAAALVKRGLAHFSPTQIAPVDTAATLKENAVWVKRQLTSGGTSK